MSIVQEHVAQHGINDPQFDKCLEVYYPDFTGMRLCLRREEIFYYEEE
jgi:hypothetical protein